MAWVTRADSAFNGCPRQPEAHLCLPLAGCSSRRSEWTDSTHPSPQRLTRKGEELAIRRDQPQTCQFGQAGQPPIQWIAVGLLSPSAPAEHQGGAVAPGVAAGRAAAGARAMGCRLVRSHHLHGTALLVRSPYCVKSSR